MWSKSPQSYVMNALRQIANLKLNVIKNSISPQKKPKNVTFQNDLKSDLRTLNMEEILCPVYWKN